MSSKTNKYFEELKNEEGFYIEKSTNKKYHTLDALSTALRKRGTNFPTYIVEHEGYDGDKLFPKCAICGVYENYLLKHIKSEHDISREDYIKQHGEPNMWISELMRTIISDNSTNNNGNAKHKTTQEQRNERSPFRLEFWQRLYPGKTDDEYTEMLTAFKADTDEKRVYTVRLDYWLEKTNGDIESAKELLRQRQRTFSKDICIAKYGQEEGMKVYEERQRKWNESLKGNLKTGFSKVSQDLFDRLKELYKEEDREYLYYHTHQGEYTVGVYRLDFYDSKHNVIIEFQGDLYHANPKMFKKDEQPHPYNQKTSEQIWNEDANKKNYILENMNNAEYLCMWESTYSKNDKDAIARSFIKKICL